MAQRTSSRFVSDPCRIDPYPELAAALRSQIRQIILTWAQCVRSAIPSVRSLAFDELQDSLPVILSRMADALASGTGEIAQHLAEQSPSQGITRFQQHYDVRELVLEDRVLRRVIIEHVQAAMVRRMSLDEQVALDMEIDVMLQEAVIAFVGLQNSQLRIAAEAELKYLSFLSHDLNNNLSGVTIFLKLLRTRLEKVPAFADDLQTLDAAEQAIHSTVGGMTQLMESERLRKSGKQAEQRPVNLYNLLTAVTRQAASDARRKGLTIVIDVGRDAVVQSDGELIGLIVQNLVGNAVKYSRTGTVRVSAGFEGGTCELSVSDEGPGIPHEHLTRIFDAFARGNAHGQGGVGLGLTIASQAAKLLRADLAVESKLGVGSTFRLALPPSVVMS